MKRVSLTTEAAKGVKEYKPSKSFTVTRQIEKEPFDREAWRQEKIATILAFQPKPLYEQYFHVITITEGEFNWKTEAVKDFDDVQLNFLTNIIDNTKKRK